MFGLGAAIPVEEVLQQLQAYLLAFFRVELHCKHVIARNGHIKVDPVVTAGRYQITRLRLNVVAVYKVEAAAVFDVGPKRMGLRLIHLVPAHVRYFQAFTLGILKVVTEEIHPALELAQTVDAIIFLGKLHQRLITDADAQKRLAGQDRLTHFCIHTQATDFSHAVADRPHTGQQHPVGRTYLFRISGHPYFNAGLNVLQCLGYRVQIAHAVVDNCNTAHDLQAPLGGRHDPFAARIKLQRHAQGPTERLEDRLGLVMGVFTLQIVDMQRYLSMINESVEELTEQIDIKPPHTTAGEFHIHRQTGTARKVDHDAGQSFIQRHVSVAVTADTLFVTHRLFECLTKGDADVFDRVVIINVQIANRADLQVDQAMPGDLIQHVIQKRHTGIHIQLPGAIEINCNSNLGFQRVAGYLGFALGHRSLRHGFYENGHYTFNRCVTAGSSATDGICCSVPLYSSSVQNPGKTQGTLIMKAFKLIAAILLIVILLLAAAVIAVVTLVDPNDYKTQIRDAALEQAGIDLNIEGDIGWSFYPWLALELNQVGVGYPEKPALGQLERAEISVSIPALISGGLQMNRILVDGLKLDLVQTKNGANNWSASSDTATNDAQSPASNDSKPADSSQGLAIDIEAIEIRNAALTFTDEAIDTRTELTDLNLSTGMVSLNQPFPLKLSFAVRQYSGDTLQLSSHADLSTDIILDLAQNHYRLDNLKSTLSLDEGAAIPAALKFALAASINAQLNEQQVEVTGLSLQADPLTLTGDLTLRNFNQPELSGTLKSNTFNLKQLLTTLGQSAPETADSNALTRLAFNATLAGPAGTVQLKPMSLQLDDTRFDGEASLILATQAIALKLKGDTLDADRYLPPQAAAVTSNTGSPGGNSKTDTGWPKDELIPLAPLQALDLNADLDLDSLKASDITLTKPGLSITADGGLIRLTRFSSGVFEGQVKATARIDARKAPLQLSISKQVSGVQIGTALQTLAQTDVVAGKLNAQADLTMSGQSIHAWVNSLNGSASLGMAEGLIKGIDAAQSLCQGVNNLSSLWINAEQVDKTTPFADLGANFTIRNGVVKNKDLKAKLDAMALAGRGSINLPKQTMDYRVGLTIEDNLFNQSCSVNDRLEGVEVPVDCKGGFNDDPAKLCRLDTSFIGDLLKAEAKRKVEEKVGGQLEEKLKDKLGEEGAGSVLKGLFGR